MKAEIDISGVLTISAETELEGFALQMWAEKNVNESTLGLIVSWNITQKEVK